MISQLNECSVVSCPETLRPGTRTTEVACKVDYVRAALRIRLEGRADGLASPAGLSALCSPMGHLRHLKTVPTTPQKSRTPPMASQPCSAP